MLNKQVSIVKKTVKDEIERHSNNMLKQFEEFCESKNPDLQKRLVIEKEIQKHVSNLLGIIYKLSLNKKELTTLNQKLNRLHH